MSAPDDSGGHGGVEEPGKQPLVVASHHDRIDVVLLGCGADAFDRIAERGEDLRRVRTGFAGALLESASVKRARSSASHDRIGKETTPNPPTGTHGAGTRATLITRNSASGPNSRVASRAARNDATDSSRARSTRITRGLYAVPDRQQAAPSQEDHLPPVRST